jgi:hypothetical protein
MNQVRIKELRAYMKELPAGQIAVGAKGNVEQLLFEAWNELTLNTADSRVAPYKLVNRTEALTWQPPLLTFQIESYESTTEGSMDAKVHQWIVNLETAEALIECLIPVRNT